LDTLFGTCSSRAPSLVSHAGPVMTVTAPLVREAGTLQRKNPQVASQRAPLASLSATRESLLGCRTKSEAALVSLKGANLSAFTIYLQNGDAGFTQICAAAGRIGPCKSQP